MDSVTHRIDAWAVALIFVAGMLACWELGRWWGRRYPPQNGETPETRFAETSMALLGLLLAFTFAMTLVRHDHRRLMLVAECNAIGDFNTCAALLPEPRRSALQAVIRQYTQIQCDTLRRLQPEAQQQEDLRRSWELQGRMTELVSLTLAAGTPIAVCLANTLNEVTSAHASRVAAYEEVLPWSVKVLLWFGAMVPSFLMGRQQGGSQEKSRSGMLSFIVLVTLVSFVTLDLDQPRRGLIQVNRAPFERLVESLPR